MIFRSWLVVGAIAAALSSCTAEPAAVAARPVAAAVSPAGLALVPLQITSGERNHRFTVELAGTAEEQQRGLMFRTTLGPNEGMIFPFPRPRMAGFWMMNTLIPLDMLFIRADGKIARIAVNTVPHSTESVLSGEPVGAVLELAGGRTVELGIKEGDLVTWQAPPQR